MNKRQLYESIMKNVAKEVKKALIEADENKPIIIDKSKIQPKVISDKVELLNLIKQSHPDKSSNTGFWLFDEAIKKDEAAYTNINKEPFYIKYIGYFYDDKLIALRSFSTNYYDRDELKDGRFKGFVRLFDFQVDSKYKGNNLQQYAWDHLENIVKKQGYKGFTLMCYEKSLLAKYKRDGFQGDEYLMWKKFKKFINYDLQRS